MGIQSAILVYDENGRQLGRFFIAGVLAVRPRKIAFDVPISKGGGYRLVAGFDSLIVLANLLTQCVVRHQRLDNHFRSKTSNGETLHPIKELTTTDLSVNVTC